MGKQGIKTSRTKSGAAASGTLFPPSLPEVFREVHSYLYTNSNIPRVERLGGEMIRLLFCKIYDEVHAPGESAFRAESGESPEQVGSRIRVLFDKVKGSYSDVFGEEERISLDDRSIQYVVEKLQPYTLIGTARDVVSEAFQAFWGPGLRGEKGQFFTPRNVVRMCVEMLSPQGGERVIDPACGSGGFLVEVLPRSGQVYGIDKEIDLVKICKAYMAILGDGHRSIYCADSLLPSSWPADLASSVSNEAFDIVLTNPPFGAKIFIEDQNLLRNYCLGHRWARSSDRWKMTNRVSKQVPQLLFVERCLQLLRPGGRMAIVLPDGVFGNPSDRYVWEFIREHARILAIVSLPAETFLPSTHTKTSVLFLEKTVPAGDYEFFMAIADRVGHDKNGKVLYKIDPGGRYILDQTGNRVIDDDLPVIASNYRDWIGGRTIERGSHLGFTLRSSEVRDHIFIPGYYNPETVQRLRSMERSGRYRLVTIGELVDRRVISIKRGNEVGSRFYGMGDVPFVRTSDIVNWEVKIDPVKCVPEEVYEQYRRRQDVRENDILLVTDGTFLIGRTALVTPLDRRMVIQSHIRRIRSLQPDMLHPFLLLYLLNTEIVQRQIAEKTFVQATISTVGNRLQEIVLPIPTDAGAREAIIERVAEIIRIKIEARKKLQDLLKEEKNG